jgi:regulator of sigma E protease
MLNIIGAIFALGILITVHELGHFIAARIFGVEAEKFSIGFGPPLISFTMGKTNFRISLIPLGGYLKMKGENPDEETDTEGSFKSKKWWQRAIIAFAGPFANFLFALFIFIVSFTIGRSYDDHLPVIGKINTNISYNLQVNDRILALNEQEIISWNDLVKHTKEDELNFIEIERDHINIFVESSEITPKTWLSDILPYVPAVIGEVAPGMPAYQAGLMEMDEILAVDGVEIENWYEMRELIINNVNDEVNLKIKRNNQVFEKSINLEKNILDDNKIIGITQYLPLRIHEKYGLLESLKYGSISTVSFVVLNYIALYKLLTKPSILKESISGPVMIFTMSQQSVKRGWGTILSFVAAISLILMIMNLLPIPILDGGQIFFCFIEGIFRKPLSIKVQMVLQNIGLFMLMFLMVFAFFNDFSKIFKRNISIHEQKTVTE